MIATKDILLLRVSLERVVTVCRGEWGMLRLIGSGKRSILEDLTDVACTLEDLDGFLDYMANGGKVEPIVKELEESLSDFLESAAVSVNEYAPLSLADGAREWITMYLEDLAGESRQDELRQVTFNVMGKIIDLCSEWLRWLQLYFPSCDTADSTSAAYKISKTIAKLEPTTAREINSCLLVSAIKQAELLKKLHQLIDGERGKGAALVIRLCVELGLMRKPTFGVLKAEFPGIGNKSGYNTHYREYETRYTKEEIEGMKANLITFQDYI